MVIDNNSIYHYLRLLYFVTTLFSEYCASYLVLGVYFFFEECILEAFISLDVSISTTTYISVVLTFLYTHIGKSSTDFIS